MSESTLNVYNNFVHVRS